MSMLIWDYFEVFSSVSQESPPTPHPPRPILAVCILGLCLNRVHLELF